MPKHSTRLTLHITCYPLQFNEGSTAAKQYLKS